MWRDGQYAIVKYEYFKPDSRGNVKVRLWFSHDETPRWPHWGVGPDKESATNDALQKFLSQAWVDAGRAARVVAYGEVVVAKEAKRRERWAKRNVVPLPYAPRDVQLELLRKKNPR